MYLLINSFHLLWIFLGGSVDVKISPLDVWPVLTLEPRCRMELGFPCLCILYVGRSWVRDDLGHQPSEMVHYDRSSVVVLGQVGNKF